MPLLFLGFSALRNPYASTPVISIVRSSTCGSVLCCAEANLVLYKLMRTRDIHKKILTVQVALLFAVRTGKGLAME